jgi:hypothetical protein
MNAIQTKYLPPTAHRGARIKATCCRGSRTIDYHSSNIDPHVAAVDLLVLRFCNEDLLKYKTPPKDNPWNRPRVTGNLPDGSIAHVYLPR